MKEIKIRNQFTIIGFLLLALIACNEQVKKHVSQETEIPQYVADTTDQVDALFFIEGQLCQHLREIFEDSKGNLWFGTNNYGIMRYDGDTLIYYNDDDNTYGSGRITSIIEDKTGNVWFSAYRALTKYDGKTFSTYTRDDGILNDELWDVIIDSKGIFWLATTDGLTRFDGTTFTNIRVPKAKVKDTTTTLAYNRITSLVEDRNGILWMGTDGFGITKYDGKTFTFLTKEDGLPDNNIYRMMRDSKDNIWIGTMFGGVSKFDGKTFANYTQDGIIKGEEVGAFFEDKNNNIWFAAENYGVYRYDGNSFTNYYKDANLITNGILSIYQDKKNRFWFGGWGGLFRFDGKTFTPVTREGPWQ